jgi:alpha-L-fucosidase
MAEYTGTFESLRDRPLPTWFDDAKFGIFVHWYPSSVPAFAPLNPDPFTLAREQGEFVAFTESPYSEWYVNSMAIEGSSVQRHHAATYGDKPYDEFVAEFFESARSWRPAEWAELFAAAGATYCVMGTKHLDGALLWPSARPNPFKGAAWSSTRDIVGDAIDAVRDAGLRAGVYYCGGLDLTFQGLGFDSFATIFAAVPQTDPYRDYATDHYRELIARYRPDVLWNDVGFPGFGTGAAPLMAEFYGINPDGVVNDRFDPIGVAMGTAHADFVTPEYSLERTVSAKKFEVCRGIGTSFGYNRLESDATYLSSEALIELLVDVVADGGNLLLNVGPKPDGEIPAEQRQRLLDIGAWLDVNGAAIHGSRPHEVSTLETSDGRRVRVTRGADGATYAIVLGAVTPELTIPGLPAGEVTLLGDGVATRIPGTLDSIALTLPPLHEELQFLVKGALVLRVG